MTSPLGIPLCMAGRHAFFMGQWSHVPPCPNPGRHRIITEILGAEADLCEEHFEQVLNAGLISHPYMRGMN